MRQYPNVAVVNIRLDTYADPNSIAKVNLLFVSEAPPGGQNLGSFFHIPQREDPLRRKLFAALSHTETLRTIQGMENEKGLQFFLSNGLYLLPSFNFPCSKRDNLSGHNYPKNANPTYDQLTHSSTHLRDEINLIRPKKVFTLGNSALFTVLQGFGSTTQEAAALARSVTRTSRLDFYVGTTFHIDTGEDCEVWIENWPRIPSMKNVRFKRLVRVLREALDMVDF
jgi:hypothetical protein